MNSFENNNLEKQLDQVDQFIQKEAFEPALALLSSLINLYPVEPIIYTKLGWIAFKKNKLDESEEYFEKALKLDINNPEYTYNLGWIYFYNNKIDLAKEYYLKTIDLQPDNSLPYINIGAIKYETNQYKKALEYYLKAKDLDPENTHLLNNLGDTCQKLQHYDKSIETYQYILTIDNMNARAYGNMALSYHETGNTSLAEEFCKKALEINPSSVNAHYNLSTLYYDCGNYEAAYKEIIQAHNLSKHFNQAILVLLISIKKKLSIDYEDELLILSKLTNKDPLYLYISEKNHQKVIDILLKRLEKEPMDFFNLSQLAYTLSQLGEYEKAIEIFEIALKINDSEAWSNQHYAFALEQYNRKDEAINYYKKAIQINPYVLWPQKQLANLYIKQEEYYKASEIIENALINIDYTEDRTLISEIFSLKAEILLIQNSDEALDWYLLAILYNPDESYNYEKVSSLLATSYSNEIKALLTDVEYLNNNAKEKITYYCYKAIGNHRKGIINNAFDYYKKALDEDISCYPAYNGMSQVLYEKRYSSIKISHDFDIKLDSYISNYNELNDIEKAIIRCSIFPFKQYLDQIIASEGSLTLVTIDTKITSFEETHHLREKYYLDGTPYQSLRAIGSMRSFIGIERIRDILWKVPVWLKQVPATVAHEYAHQVYYILDQKEKDIVDNIYLKTIKKSLPLVSDYSALNSEEFFAENYSYFVRNLFHKGKVVTDSEILNHIFYLSDLDKNLKNREVVF